MENIFAIAAQCLQQPSIEKKLALTHHASALSLANGLSLDTDEIVLPIEKTRFPDRPVLLSPKHMPQRKLHTDKGKAAFFHALAHIEFIAIYLAWDIIYRFRGLPEQFYRDWLKVADEEAQHFSLLQAHLQSMGLSYGDLPAHGGLWDHAERTAEDLLGRLAIVPRCLEARGLDVTQETINKFQAMGDQKAVEILSRILADEIGHVKFGSDWFRYCCEQEGKNAEQTYREMIEKYFRGKPRGPFNRELRIIAGFTNDEIDWLERD